MTGQRPLTLAEILEQVDRIGGDPATTTFRTWTGPVSADDNLVGREHGAVVLDFSGDFDEHDDGADDLRMELVAANVELDQANKVVTAARAWAETGKGGGFDHLQASLHLLSAVEAHANAQATAITGEPPPSCRAAKLATLIGAVSAWWAVEATRTSQTEHSSIWLEAEKAARRALCIAAQDYETAEQL